MSIEGLHRAGYRQIALNVDSMVITSSMSSTTCPWSEGFQCLHVISSGAVFGEIVDATMTNADLIDSGSTFPNNARIYGNAITKVKVSTKTTGHKIIAYRKVLL